MCLCPDWPHPILYAIGLRSGMPYGVQPTNITRRIFSRTWRHCSDNWSKFQFNRVPSDHHPTAQLALIGGSPSPKMSMRKNRPHFLSVYLSVCLLTLQRAKPSTLAHLILSCSCLPRTVQYRDLKCMKTKSNSVVEKEKCREIFYK